MQNIFLENHFFADLLLFSIIFFPVCSLINVTRKEAPLGASFLVGGHDELFGAYSSNVMGIEFSGCCFEKWISSNPFL